MNKPKHDWGDYYYQGKRKNGKTRWILDMIHSINTSIPTFNELFDEETFYVFVVLFVIATILVVIFLAKCVGIKLKEHDVYVDRDWGTPAVADPFRFPWQTAEYRKLETKTKKE
ncbi:unnamed protein product [Caenorhabditis bovis]|uniref:Uncharacterized protein n=1 Tax=Caenorhabditis bovis TaxID=2654633 RepID=A0A8S1EKA5_9PELO|nr:unnamed protein product [Caenorhabditis bovis]